MQFSIWPVIIFHFLSSFAWDDCQNPYTIQHFDQVKDVQPLWYDTSRREIVINCLVLPCVCWNHYNYWVNNQMNSVLFQNDYIVFHYQQSQTDRPYVLQCRNYFKEQNAVSCFDYNGQCNVVPYASTSENQDAIEYEYYVQTACIPSNQNQVHLRCLGAAINKM